ncbi:hypothetical protein QCD60_28535 [Pokkaliibacter sp. MBI-7]|nr:hypothetical protein [Pokkaliibacter sp. MBI-7]MDH2436465.1 hypothetical protein [Pokkaliibacter sp. MBI-7]
MALPNPSQMAGAAVNSDQRVMLCRMLVISSDNVQNAIQPGCQR